MRRAIIAIILLLVGASATAQIYSLTGLDEVARHVGNKDGEITATEFPELVFRHALLPDGQAHTLCEPNGTSARSYDWNGSGRLEIDELSCFLTNNNQRLKEKIEKKGDTIEERVEAVKLDVALVKESRKVAFNQLRDHAGGGPAMTFDQAEIGNEALNASYYPKKDEADLDSLERWKISRQLIDKLVARESKIARPFILSYKEDQEKKTETLIFNGDISFRNGQIDRLKDKKWLFQSSAILSLDVDTAKKSFDNSIAFANKFSWFIEPSGDLIDEWVLEATPKYTTDRHFRRDVVSLALAAGFASRKLGRAGHFTPALADFERRGEFRFLWKPKLSLEVGEVRDDGGNAGLAEQKLQGTYYRLLPRIDWTLKPMGLGRRFSMTGSYTHLFDVEDGRDHGLGEIQLQYDLAKFLALTFGYSKGRNLTTLEKTDGWLIGIGVTKSK